jgi:ethanolamine utilization microcompartment shell protein EutS
MVPVMELWSFETLKVVQISLAFALMSQLLIVGVNIATCWSDSRLGFGLDIGFIDHFSTQLVITVNYNAIADFHTLQVSCSSQYLH